MTLKVLYVRADGKQQRITQGQAEEKIRCGAATHAGRKDGMECIVEQRQPLYQDRAAELWVKDRGVKGGKYGRPYEPNGRTLADGLFCGGAQFHLAHQ